MSKGTIIYLNGVTSSGKTSIVQALRTRGDLEFYYLSDDIFEDSPLHVVEVYCPLQVCRARNLTRHDRYEAQSEEQAAVMAQDVAYTLHLDTSTLSPAQCAAQIVDQL